MKIYANQIHSCLVCVGRCVCVGVAVDSRFILLSATVLCVCVGILTLALLAPDNSNRIQHALDHRPRHNTLRYSRWTFCRPFAVQRLASPSAGPGRIYRIEFKSKLLIFLSFSTSFVLSGCVYVCARGVIDIDTAVSCDSSCTVRHSTLPLPKYERFYD